MQPPTLQIKETIGLNNFLMVFYCMREENPSLHSYKYTDKVVFPMIKCA